MPCFMLANMQKQSVAAALARFRVEQPAPQAATDAANTAADGPPDEKAEKVESENGANSSF